DLETPAPAVRTEVARPAPRGVRRHDPELDLRQAAETDRLLRRAHFEFLVRRPGADAAVVRDDARPRPEAKQLRQQLGIEVRQKIERDHTRTREIGFEDVADLEAR